MAKKTTRNIIIENVTMSDGYSFLSRVDHYTPENEIGYHQHTEMEIVYVNKGSGLHSIGNVIEPSVEGEVVIVSPNIPHAWMWDNTNLDSDGRIENYNLQFDVGTIARSMGQFSEMKRCADFLTAFNGAVEITGDDAEAVKKRMKRINEVGGMGRLLLLLEILDIMSRSRSIRLIISSDGSSVVNPERAKIDRVYRYILSNYTKTISLDEAASVACLNKSSFCTFFKRITGRTFTQIVNEYRINRACTLLGTQGKEKSIKDICFAVGYGDVPHFNRVFQQLKGYSPRAYISMVGSNRKPEEITNSY